MTAVRLAASRPRRRSVVHLFVLWSEARTEERRIVDDIAATFTVVDVVEVHWAPDETFSRNLSRMYGAALPPGSDKEMHCGKGPFLVVVVEDRHPRYRLRRTSRGRRMLNANVFDARRRYREWTGGGYRVHASDSIRETEQNLLLLLGTEIRALLSEGQARRGLRVHAADPVGTDGWRSVGDLVHALRLFHGRNVRVSEDGGSVRVLTIDPWWTGQIAGGRELAAGVREVPVGEGAVVLTIQAQPRRVRKALTGVLRPLRRLAGRCRARRS